MCEIQGYTQGEDSVSIFTFFLFCFGNLGTYLFQRYPQISLFPQGNRYTQPREQKTHLNGGFNLSFDHIHIIFCAFFSIVFLPLFSTEHDSL